MSKIKCLALMLSLGLVASCTQLSRIGNYSLSSSWEKSPAQVFTGNFQKDGLTNNYRVELEPLYAQRADFGKKELRTHLKFTVSGSDYKATYHGRLSLIGDVKGGEDGAPYKLSSLKVMKPIEFDQIDPLIYVNIWPSVQRALDDNFAKIDSLTIDKR